MLGRNKLNKQMILTILALAWPTVLEQLMQTAVQYIDTAMVGSLGTQATAAVGATTTVNWLINITISAVAVGFLSYIAKACGAKDEDRAASTAAQAVTVTLILGTIATIFILSISPYVPIWMQVDHDIQNLAAKYFFILYVPMLPRTATIIFGTVLRAAGDTKTPMKVGVMVNLVNVILNFLLIYPTRTVFFLWKNVLHSRRWHGSCWCCDCKCVCILFRRYLYNISTSTTSVDFSNGEEFEAEQGNFTTVHENCIAEYAATFWNGVGVCCICGYD